MSVRCDNAQPRVANNRLPSRPVPPVDAGTVRLDPGTTKSGEGRVIHMTADLRTLLESQRAITDAYQKKHEKICPWVFHRNGQRIRIVRPAWQTACRLAGCPGRIPHDLRRTAVRNVVRAGVSEHVAMKLSGHKTASVFRRSDVVSDADLGEAARKLDRALGIARERVQRSASAVTRSVGRCMPWLCWERSRPTLASSP